MADKSPRKRSRVVESCAHRRTRVKLGDAAVPAAELSRSNPSELLPANADGNIATDNETDDENELSDSSEDPSSESSGEEGSEDDSEDSLAESHEQQEESAVVNLRANRGKKPSMKFSKDDLGPDIRDFLKDFLPQLKAANDELEAERQAGTLKNRKIEAEDDGEGQYIEMNLGLGVLEERDPNAPEDPPESDSETANHQKEKDVMGKLLGRQINKEPPTIQEVDNKQGA